MIFERSARRARKKMINKYLAEQDQQHPSSKLDELDALARDLDEPSRPLIPAQPDRRGR